MAEQNFTPKRYSDFQSVYKDGINQDAPPQDLKKTQLSNAVNASMRGSFVNSRPPFQIQNFNFNGNAALQTLVLTGFYQGGEYYSPDYGPASFLAQISGHLILFTNVNELWNVSDVSVPNDLNNASTPMVWMWQSEKWMVINDGTGVLPIFFDGTVSRRSAGASVVLTVASAAAPTTPPAIGAQVSLTVSPDYPGPFNVPVIFNGEYYMPITSATPPPAGFGIILTNLTDTTATIPAGTAVVANPNIQGVINNGVTGPYNAGSGTYPAGFFTVGSLTLLNTPPFIVGALVVIYSAPGAVTNGIVWKVTGISGKTISMTTATALNVVASGDVFIYPPGTVIYSSVAYPTNTIGLTVGATTVPAIASNVNATLTTSFSNNPEIVQIGTAYYIITSNLAPPPSGSGTLIMVNLTDVSTANYVYPANIQSVPELPAGAMGAYGLGRSWFSLVGGITYAAGDAVGGPSGSAAFNYRDAVLKYSENTFLAGGGFFTLPGTGDQITAIFFPATLDTSLGQGACMVSTSFNIFSNNAPADRSTWETIQYPIQTESLKGEGALGQNSTVNVNSDTLFRIYNGFGSLVLARREFYDWGNKTISNELQKTLYNDNITLMTSGSSLFADNRFESTVHPVQTGSGVVFQGFTSLNFDLLSSLRINVPPSWEGIWTGLNIYQLIQGKFNGTKRAFAFTKNYITGNLELYESLPESTKQFADNGDVPIGWYFETATWFNADIKPLTELCQLRDGECYISGIQGDVKVKVFYRPDYYPCWQLWNSFEVSQTANSPNAKNGYRMRIGFGEPDPTPVENGNNRPLRVGYFFQLRVEITGCCTWNGCRLQASSMPEPVFAPIEYPGGPAQEIDCDTTPLYSFYSLQGSPA